MKCSSDRLPKAVIESYAPSNCECWILLANAIMRVYSEHYIYQIPTHAVSQNAYNILDEKEYAPMREMILRRIKYGPIRNGIDIGEVYAGLERCRQENKEMLGIKWKDNYHIDLDAL